MKNYLYKLILVVLVFTLAGSCSKEEIKSNEKEILTFEVGSFGANAKGKIDATTRTITFEVAADVDITKATPIITVSPAATVSPTSGTEQDFSKEVRYVVTAEDGTKQSYTVKVKRLSGSKSITAFKLASLKPVVEGVINEEAKTIELTVPAGTNVRALVPTIELSPRATVSPASGSVQDFSNNITYTVTAQDGTTADYVVSVTVAQASGKEITQLTLAGLTPAVTGTIDQAKRTVKLAVPTGTNIKSLVPTITLSPNATVSPASGVAQDFSAPVTYTVTAQDGTTAAYTVSVEVVKASGKEITQLTLAGLTPAVTGTIDQAAKTVKLAVPYGTDVTALVPTIALSAGATVSPASGVAQSFTSPVAYTVTAENGTTATYTVTVEVAKLATAITGVDKTSAGAGETIVITGTFAADAPTVALEGATTVALTVASHTATTITATIPAGTALGEYTLSVTSDGTKATYATKIRVINPNLPVITATNKASYIRGVDELVITGRNLNQAGKTAVVQIGSSVHNISINAAGTEGRLIVPSTATLGRVSISINYNGDPFTNELEITIEENVTPAPTITGVSATSLFLGDELTITGTSFQPSGNTVLLDGGFMYELTPDIISESTTQIVVRIPENKTATDYTLKVTSNGKQATYATPIVVSKGTTTLTGLESTTVKVGASIVVKGRYIYNNDTNQRMKVYIDGEQVSATFKFVNLTTLEVATPALAAGSHTVEVTTYSGSPMLATTTFTVAP